MALRIVFAGTPEFAVPSLRAAASRNEVVAVYTQPDRPAGRGRGLQASKIKLEAIQRGIPVLQPESLKSQLARDALRALKPDLLVVVAYGLILPQSILDIPTHGCWNVHASLLPRWRGAAPIQRAIEAGDGETGVCLMQMEKGLDTGPVLLSQRIAIGAHETGGQLHDRLAELGAQTLADGLGLLRAGMRPVPQPQLAVGVTYAHKLDKAEAWIDFAAPAEVLARRIRAFDPFPVASTQWRDTPLKVWAACAQPANANAPAGTVVAIDAQGVHVATGGGTLCLTELQRAGGKRLPAKIFLAGTPIAVGDRFDGRRAGAQA